MMYFPWRVCDADADFIKVSVGYTEDREYLQHTSGIQMNRSPLQLWFTTHAVNQINGKKLQYKDLFVSDTD